MTIHLIWYQIDFFTTNINIVRKRDMCIINTFILFWNKLKRTKELE